MFKTCLECEIFFSAVLNKRCRLITLLFVSVNIHSLLSDKAYANRRTNFIIGHKCVCREYKVLCIKVVLRLHFCFSLVRIVVRNLYYIP